MPTQDLAWMDDAACSGLPVEWFFIEIGGSSAKARSVCETCPVKTQCLQYGAREEEGIWGGATVAQRRVFVRTGVIGGLKKRGLALCGTYSAYTRGCRCLECKKAKSVYNKRYRARRKALGIAS